MPFTKRLFRLALVQVCSVLFALFIAALGSSLEAPNNVIGLACFIAYASVTIAYLIFCIITKPWNPTHTHSPTSH